MRAYAMATMDNERPGQDNVSKLLWANWHRSLGELAMDVLGKPGLVPEGWASPTSTNRQRLYLFSRSDTIYGGSQRDPAQHSRRAGCSACPGEVKG